MLIACDSNEHSNPDAPISLVCPTVQPSGGPCSPNGLVCSYGDSVRPECRTVSRCVDGAFVQLDTNCTPSPPGLCPESPATLAGDCQNAGAVCDYPDGTLCTCSLCHGGPCHTTASWGCTPPPTTAGCPMIAPNEGTACAMNGLLCIYGDACSGSGAVATCSAGAWIWQPPVCPLD